MQFRAPFPLFTLATAVSLSVAPPAFSGPAVCVETNDVIRITLRGKPVLTYQKAIVAPPGDMEDLYSRSGYIHPVYSPSGKEVTGDFPVDHPHQHALFFAWTSTTFEGRKVDFWNQRAETGLISHSEVLSLFNEPESAGFSVKIVHSDRSAPGGEKPVLDEIWTVRVHATPPGEPYLFDLESVQTCASESPLTLNEYQYGAMAIRGNQQWFDPDYAKAIAAWEKEKKKNPEAPAPTQVPQGDFLTSEGKNRLNGNHSRPNWVDMFGKTDGEDAGIAMLSHPSNFRSPQPVRLHPSKPYFCFSPVVLGEFQIVPGKKYTSRYRFLVHDGKPDPVQIDQKWKEYSGEKK